MDIIASYEKHKNLKLAANELGMPWQTLYWQLKQAKHPVTGDKLRYGSASDKLGRKAEVIFGTLVPDAEDLNAKNFQPPYDFSLNGIHIDIKAARLLVGNKRYEARRWAFTVSKQEAEVDFVVGFAFLDDLENYRIFLLPGEMVRKYSTISISEKGKSKWLDFEITQRELVEFFESVTGEHHDH
jgi:hypothetical protein